MRTNLARWTGVALALVGMSVSARAADSIHAGTLSSDNGKGNFEASTSAPQVQNSSARNPSGHGRAVICCARAGEVYSEDSYEAFDAQPQESLRIGHEAPAVFTTGSVNVAGRALAGSFASTTAGSTFEGALAYGGGYGNAVGSFALSGGGGSGSSGHGSSATDAEPTWLSVRGQGPSSEDNSWVTDPQLDGPRGHEGAGALGAHNGNTGLAAATNDPPANTPMDVPEPAVLALLGAGLTALGVLVLRRGA